MGMTTTASDVIDSVLTELQEDTVNPVFWSRAELLALVWEGLVDINLIAGYLQRTDTIALNGNALQGATTDIAILRMRVGTRSLEKFSVDDMDANFPTWENDSTSTTDGIKHWANAGLTKIVTHKRTLSPPQSVSVDVLRLHPVLTESTVLLIDDEWSNALEDYVFHVARLKEGGLELQQSMANYQRYLDQVAELARRTAWKSEPGWTQTPKAKIADAVPRQP